MINKPKFYQAIKKAVFGGVLIQVQVEQMNAILDEWDSRGLTNIHWLAYMFATNIGECGRNMAPVREGFKTSDLEARAYVKRRGYKYAKVIGGQVYYGRGRVQLTWLFNYEKAGKELGVDLVNNPDLALDPVIATRIMFDGMIQGWFTGKKLQDYFNVRKTDYFNARRIINGLDRAAEIGGVAQKFYKALVESKQEIV